MLDYPPSFPTDAIRVVILRLRGTDVHTPLLVRALWNVVGWGFSQALPDVNIASSGATLVSDETLASSLEAYADAFDEKPAAYAALPWVTLVPALLRLLLSLVGGEPTLEKIGEAVKQTTESMLIKGHGGDPIKLPEIPELKKKKDKDKEKSEASE